MAQSSTYGTPNGSNEGRSRPRVLIIGGGFAGIHAAQGLAKLPVDVTLIDRRNHHTFQPLLYQVAVGALSPANIAQPIRAILRKRTRVEVLMDEAIGFDLGRRRVVVKSGVELEYDYLMVATGATHSYFGKDEWAPLAPGLKSIEDATEIRRRIIIAFESAERETVQTGVRPLVQFVVIGGGPTGVELAGAISDISKNFVRGSFRKIDPANAKVLLLEGNPKILAAYPDDLSKKGVEQLERMGVEIRTGAKVTDIQPGYVMLGEERISSSVTLWGAGVQASPLGALLGLGVDKRGRVKVDEQLNPEGHAEVFVCGDLAAVVEDGRDIPGVAQPAMQMGDHVARMIRQDLAGKPRTAFHYFDKGDMATIGRYAAVAKVEWPFKAHWGGFMAWITWLAVHIFFLMGFRNRISVLCEWCYALVTSSCAACLITGNTDEKAGVTMTTERSTPISARGAEIASKAVALLLCSVTLIALVGCSGKTSAAGQSGGSQGGSGSSGGQSGSSGGQSGASGASQGPMPLPVTTATQQTVSLTGEWVATTDGFVNAQIQPQVSGYLIRQDYKEGSLVRKGQVLFEIDPRTYQAQLDQTKAAVGQAQASVAQAQAQLDLAGINVRRDTPLAQARAIAQSQLDNELQTQQADIASVAAAEAQVKSAEAQVRTAELNLGFTKVRSLVDGVAGQAALQVGSLVNTGSVLTSVSQLNPIKVFFSISEQEYLALSARAKARGKSDLLSSGNTLPLKLTLSNGEVYPESGRIFFVDRSVSADTGSLRLAASFPNPRNLLRPGQFGRVKAETDTLQNAVVIPQRAVNDLQGQNQVYVVASDNTVKAQPVQLGAQIGPNIVITTGLKGGERIATESLDKLKDGMKVQPQAEQPATQNAQADAPKPGGN